MLKYILRRVLYMIPTVLGVVMITFVLFYVVGGSPALSSSKKSSPRSLQEFEEQRHLHKPPIFGRWATTRAYASGAFEKNAGSWQKTSNVVHHAAAQGTPAHISLAAVGHYTMPLHFELRPSSTYRVVLKYRLQDGRAGFEQVAGPDTTRRPVPPGPGWRRTSFEFPIPPEGTPFALKFAVEAGTLEIASIALQERTAHLFDSRLWFFLRQIASGDFGESARTNQKISDMLREGILPSLALAVPIFVIELMVAVSLALVCAFFRNTFIDRFFVVASVVLMSVNYLVWIIAGQYVLAYMQHWFPIWGFESWSYLVLPVIIGVVSGLGTELRLYRTIMLDEMYKDYVRTAFAKGVSRSGVLFKHVLKNAMIPILTNTVMAVTFLYTGNLLLEGFFGIPGLGSVGINAINNSDFDVIKVVVLVGSVIFVVANLLTDICYALVDPRVRLK